MAQVVKESLSIEETNKIRISLGLTPLPTENDKGKELDKDSIAEQNYSEHQKSKAKEQELKQAQERILKVKENRERLSKLKGRGLGELDQAEDEDLKQWVKRHKKSKKSSSSKGLDPNKLFANKFEEEQEQNSSYGSNDLRGLKVAHDLEEIESNLMDHEMVLTLKDSKILEGQDDELENVELADHLRSKEATELKKQGRQAGQYTGYDDDEFLNPGQSKTILAKYSDTIDGKQERSFRLGDAQVQVDDGSAQAQDSNSGEFGNRTSKKETAERLSKGLLSLDYSKTFVDDYMQEDDPGFKKKSKKDKSSKKKKQASLRKPASDLLTGEEDSKPNPDSMDLDDPNNNPPAITVDDSNVIDDEEVQAAMSRMRREVGKLRRKNQILQKNEDVEMDSVKTEPDQKPPISEQVSENNNYEEEEEEEDGRLVIDDTSEFIRTISLHQQRAAAEENKKKEQGSSSRLGTQSVSLRQRSLSAIPEDGGDSAVDEEEERREMERLMAGYEADEKPREGGGVAVGGAESSTTTTEGLNEKKEDDPIATGSEKYVRSGMASTLSLLKSQGLIKPLTPEEREKERLYKEKTKWLIEQRRRDALREAEKERIKKMGDAKDQATREYENRVRDSTMARETMEAYRHYKPDVEIKYNDEFGRELTQKEAWKALSHKFHGKGSGKAKTEKRIKKIEEGKKLAAMASGDTPTGTNEAFRKRQEKLGSATMVLSVGNKGSAPHQEEFLSSLSKSNSSSKKSKNSSSSKEMIGANSLNSHRNNNNGNNRNGKGHDNGTDLMNGLGSQINSGITSLAPRKAGFKPISSNQSNPNNNSNGFVNDNRVISSKAKISIGLSTNQGHVQSQVVPNGSGKRKADDGSQLEGTPESKKRTS